MHKVLIFFTLFVCGATAALGQAKTAPSIYLEVSDSAIVDKANNHTINIPPNLCRVTNFNHSVDLDSNAVAFIYDSLCVDRTATVVTVYETDADSTVGLWEIGSGGNHALWLNSRQASYDNFAITYRDATEKGVVIHTMLYRYPDKDSSYSGTDTLYLGREGGTIGAKNFCSFLYFPGKVDHLQQRQIESALAIKYGALLHAPYVNSLSDTLWNPLGDDSFFSNGICGIGRDDSLSLMQPQSTIRNDYVTFGTLGPLDNLSHVMVGHDGGMFEPGADGVMVDTVQYAVVDRRWKLRAHGNGSPVLIRIMASVPVPADAVRLMLTHGDCIDTLTPNDAVGGVVFDSVAVNEGQDYILSLLVNPEASPNGAKGACGTNVTVGQDGCTAVHTASNFNISVHPNPTAGQYTAEVIQGEEGIVSIQVLDATGRIVEQYATEEKTAKYRHLGVLDTEGVYYITVSSNGQQKTFKIVVVK